MARGDALGPRSSSPSNIEQLFRDVDRIKEKVEKLTGERGDSAKSLSAIRRSELTPIANTDIQSSQAAGSTPTKAEFDKLQADVAAIYAILRKISNIIGTADIPKV